MKLYILSLTTLLTTYHIFLQFFYFDVLHKIRGNTQYYVLITTVAMSAYSVYAFYKSFEYPRTIPYYV